MDELLGYISLLMDYIESNGSQLNAETQQELARFLEEVMQFISEYSQANPVEQLQAAPQMPEMEQAMPSSNVYGFNYDYKNGRLLVKFQGNDGAGQGPVYAYEGIQPYIFKLFKQGAAIAKTTGKNKWGSWWKGKTPSIGAALHAFIKNGGYPYQRLT